MSLPRYGEYKDSGVEWLGHVPRHWKLVRLKDVADVVHGFPFDSKLFRADGAHALVRIRDLDTRETATRYSGEFVPAAAVTSSDVLIGMDGDFNVGRWLGTETALLNQRMCCVRASDPALSTFLRHALPTPLKAINDITYSTTVKHLSSLDVEKIRFALPEGNELTAIAAFLDRETAKIDALIAEQEKLIALLAEKRQATISHVVTKGLDPNAPMKDSGVAWLGDVPAHWEVVPAKRVASIFVPQRNKPELNDVGDGVCWATMEDVKQQRLRSTGLFVSLDAIAQAGSRVLGPGAVIASCVGNFGVASINEVDVVINQQLQAFVPFPEVMPEYLAFVVLASSAYFEVVGTAATLVYVNQEGFENLPVPLPPFAEQHAIVTNLSADLSDLEMLGQQSQRAIALLKERRSTLIAAAVTGQIDVRNA